MLPMSLSSASETMNERSSRYHYLPTTNSSNCLLRLCLRAGVESVAHGFKLEIAERRSTAADQLVRRGLQFTTVDRAPSPPCTDASSATGNAGRARSPCSSPRRRSNSHAHHLLQLALSLRHSRLFHRVTILLKFYQSPRLRSIAQTIPGISHAS